MDKVNGLLTMAPCLRAWHALYMATPSNPRSLGILFAILPLVGAVGAGLLGEPVIGLLVGFALAALIVTAFWLADRRAD